jgi:CHAT domain-containing protein
MLQHLGAALVLLVAGALAASANDCSDQAAERTDEQLKSAHQSVDYEGPSLADLRARIRVCVELTEQRPSAKARWLTLHWLDLILQDKHGEAEPVAREALALLLEELDAVPPAAGPGAKIHAAAPRNTEALKEGIVEARAHLAYTLEQRGRIADAQWQLRRGIVAAYDLQNARLLGDQSYRLAETYRRLGQLTVARRFFEAADEAFGKAGQQHKQMFVTIKLGSIARELGDVADALQKHTLARDYFADQRNYREMVAEIELARDHLARCRGTVSFRDVDAAADSGPGPFPCSLALAASHAQAALDHPLPLPEQLLDAATLLVDIANQRRKSAPLDVVPDMADRLHEIEELISTSKNVLASAAAHPLQQIEFARVAIDHYASLADVASVQRYGEQGTALVRHVASAFAGVRDGYLAWMEATQSFMNTYVSALYRHEPARLLRVLETYYSEPPAYSERFSGLTRAQAEAVEVERYEAFLRAERQLVDAQYTRERASSSAEAEYAAKLVARRTAKRDSAREAFLLSVPRAESPPATTIAPAVLPEPRAGELYLRYFVQAEVSFVVVRAGSETTYVDLPSRADARALVNQALTALAGVNVSVYERQQALRALRALFPWQVLEHYPDAERLVIVPDDVMHKVPFSAIPLGAKDELRWLGARFEVVRADSLYRYYAELPSTPSNDRDEVVIFADPEFGQGNLGTTFREPLFSDWVASLERLSFTVLEAERIAKLFPSARPTLYLRKSATANVLLSEPVRNAKVLHIATHGYFNPATPDIVGIAAASVDKQNQPTNGFISAARLLRSRFRNNLIVVSGCETMRGTGYAGQGVNSISQGFLAQGAGSVIGTLWEVGDRSTADFIGVFYRALRDSEGNAVAALKQARFEQSRRGLGDPRHWAAFVFESSNTRFTQQVF